MNTRREPCSSGYGRKLIFQRSWVRIPALYTWWTISTFIWGKIAMFVWKDEKEAEDCPFFIICDHVTCKKLLSSFTVKLTTLVGRLGSLPPTTKVLHDMTKDIPPTLTYVLMPSFYLLLLLSLEGEPLRSKQNSVWSLFCLNLSQHKLVSKISWNNSNSRQRFAIAIAFFVINACCDCVYEWFSN